MSDIFLFMSDDDLKAYVEERLANVDPAFAEKVKYAPLRSLAAWLAEHGDKHPVPPPPPPPVVDAETANLIQQFGLSTDEFLQARDRAAASRAATAANLQRFADLLSGPQQEQPEDDKTDE